MSDAAFDEKIMGTVHLALGRAYPSTGGTNESAIHWDLVKDLRESVRIICDGVTVFGEGPLVGRSRRRGRALTPLSAATH
jgi:aminopeptidase